MRIFELRITQDQESRFWSTPIDLLFWHLGLCGRSSATTCIIDECLIVLTKAQICQRKYISVKFDRNLWLKTHSTAGLDLVVERVFHCVVKNVRFLRLSLWKTNSFSLIFRDSNPLNKQRCLITFSQKNMGKILCSFITWNGDILKTEMWCAFFWRRFRTWRFWSPKSKQMATRHTSNEKWWFI